MRKNTELCPSTRRPAWLLARIYGFTGTSALAASLPPEAKVVDIGAGKTHFGEAIARSRDDITWINIDPRYRTMRSARCRQQKSPPNVHFLAADGFQLPMQPGSFDRVFSSALLPHVIMDSPEEGEQLVHAMAGLLREGGELAVANFIKLPYHHATHLTHVAYHQAPDQEAKRVVEAMTLNPVLHGIQLAMNATRPYTGSTLLDKI